MRSYFLLKSELISLLVFFASIIVPTHIFADSGRLSSTEEDSSESAETTAVEHTNLFVGTPLFVENAGQFHEEARFQMWGGGTTIWLAADSLWLTIMEPVTDDDQIPGPVTPSNFAIGDAQALAAEHIGTVANVRLWFPGSNPNVRLEPYGELETKFNYFLGNDPAQWRTNVRVWSGVRYVDLYPGIDLVIGPDASTSHRGMGWHLVPNAEISAAQLAEIRLAIEGAETIELHYSGQGPADALDIRTPAKNVLLPLITMSEEIGPQIEARIVTEITNGDAELVEVLSPISSTGLVNAGGFQSQEESLIWSTFIGGDSADDAVYQLAAATNDEVVVGGLTNSYDFPTTSGAFDTTYSGSKDSFVLRLSGDGSRLLYSTFIGGANGEDMGHSLALATNGDVLLGGDTTSSDFPTTSGAFDTIHSGNVDGFVLRLSVDGSHLLYSTYIGGDNGLNVVVSLADATNDEVVVGGWTNSHNFPTTSGAFDTSHNGNGGADGFVLRLSADGSRLLYSTYIGGDTGSEDVNSLAMAANGEVVLGGYTTSSDFPTTSGAFDTTYSGNIDGFVLRLSADGGRLLYSTYLGGNTGGDFVVTLAVGMNDEVVVVGRAGSDDFPTTSGAFDATYNGNGDSYVLRLSGDGSRLLYGTFIGGTDGDYVYSLALAANGDVLLGGVTTSSDFPSTSGAFDTTYSGNFDGFVLHLSADGSRMLYGTYIGGDAGNDDLYSLAVVADDEVVLGGHTQSSDFPTTSGASDTTYGDGDGFVLRMSIGTLSNEGEQGETNNDRFVRQSFDWKAPNEDGRVVRTLTEGSNIGVPLPFSFSMGGTEYIDLRLYSDGFVGFPASSVDFSPQENHCFELTGTPPAAIYGWWAHLDPSRGSGRVSYFQTTSSDFVIEFMDVETAADVEPAYKVSFQIVLQEGGGIWLNYLTVPENTGATLSATLGATWVGGDFHDWIFCRDGDSTYGLPPTVHESYVLFSESALPCAVNVDKLVYPALAQINDQIGITLQLNGDCDSEVGAPIDAVLLFDRSGSMCGPKLDQAQAAGQVFLDNMAFPPDRASVISFANTAQLHTVLTGSRSQATDAINNITCGGLSRIDSGLIAALDELTGIRAVAGHTPTVILLTDGNPEGTYADDVRAAAQQIRAAGVQLYTIGLGSEVNASLLREIASQPTYYYQAPSPDDLAQIYTRLAGELRNVAALAVELTDVVASQFEIVPGSFRGIANPTVDYANSRLSWSLPSLDIGTSEVSFNVRPKECGTFNVNESASVSYDDNRGERNTLTFPIPAVTVEGCDEQLIDVYIRDGNSDTGDIPSAIPWWVSPDVWVRHVDDGGTQHENPIVGQRNHIYARVWNRGNTQVSNIDVTFYYASPGLGLAWPNAWSPLPVTQRIDSLAPGQSTVVSVPWDVPNIEGHFCLFVRIDAPQDPIRDDRVEWENNVAQRNLHIIDFPQLPDGECRPEDATVYDDRIVFDVVNTLDASTSVDVEITATDLPNDAEVYLTPGALANRWSSLTNLQEEADGRLRIIGFPAAIYGIRLNPNESRPITMDINAQGNQPFTISFTEYARGNVVGGNTYQRTLPTCYSFLPLIQKKVCIATGGGPVDVMLAIDTSGSMDAALADEKIAAKSFIDRMDLTDDQIGVVSFANIAALSQTLTRSAISAKAVIDSLISTGSTNIGDAITIAQVELSSSRSNPNATPVLILMSDGQPNEGSDPVVAARAAKDAGIIIITIGLGSNIDEALLRQLASSTDYYYFAPTSAELDAIYQQIAESVTTCPGQEPEPEPVEPYEITVQASSGNAYQIRHQQNGEGLAVGSRVYSDRTYEYDSIPGFLQGLSYIATANDDQERSENELRVTIRVNKSTRLYVAHSDAQSTKPAWFARFQDTGQDLTFIDNEDREVTLSVFQADFPAGDIVLGGNGPAGSDIHSMYTISFVNLQP